MWDMGRLQPQTDSEFIFHASAVHGGNWAKLM